MGKVLKMKLVRLTDLTDKELESTDDKPTENQTEPVDNVEPKRPSYELNDRET